MEKACDYLVKYISITSNYYYTSKLQKILSSKKVVFKPEYYKYWKFRIEDVVAVNQTITTLFLVFKNKKECKNKQSTSLLVKGILTEIIKYFCHFNQKSKNKEQKQEKEENKEDFIVDIFEEEIQNF